MECGCDVNVVIRTHICARKNEIYAYMRHKAGITIRFKLTHVKLDNSCDKVLNAGLPGPATSNDVNPPDVDNPDRPDRSLKPLGDRYSLPLPSDVGKERD